MHHPRSYPGAQRTAGLIAEQDRARTKVPNLAHQIVGAGHMSLEPNYPTLIEENAIAAGKAVDPALFSEAERLIERALRPHNESPPVGR